MGSLFFFFLWVTQVSFSLSLFFLSPAVQRTPRPDARADAQATLQAQYPSVVQFFWFVANQHFFVYFFLGVCLSFFFFVAFEDTRPGEKGPPAIDWRQPPNRPPPGTGGCRLADKEKPKAAKGTEIPLEEKKDKPSLSLCRYTTAVPENTDRIVDSPRLYSRPCSTRTRGEKKDIASAI